MNDATVLISENILQETADAIREKENVNTPIKPLEFAERIRNINNTATSTEIPLCTIIINNEVANKGDGVLKYLFTILENGQIKTIKYDHIPLLEPQLIFENVICNSGCYVCPAHNYNYTNIFWTNNFISASITGAPYFLGSAPSEANSTGIISLEDDDD